MTTREQIVQEARRWLGTPFKHQGRVLGSGVDCGGVVVQLAYQFGFDDGYEDPKGYPPQPHTDFMERLLERYAEPVAISERQPADIVTFAFSRNIHHIGILTSKDTFLHAWNQGPGSVVVESGLHGVFLRRMRRCYRFKGIE